MSTQIDPVTGLPMYVPPPLEQIPFKNPPYPWNDLTDNPVTPRPTYYGDDSIPTVSTIAGMHPTELGGQTVNTDGNHALLVKSVGGGAGFSGTAPYLFGGDWDYHFIGANSGAVRFGGIGTKQYLYSFDLSWFVDSSNSHWPITGLLSAGFYNDLDQEMPIIVIGIYANSATSGDTKAGRESRVFLPAVELANSGIETGGSGYQLVVRNETNGDLNYNVNTIMSPT